MRARRDQGFALLTTLWCTVVIALMVTIFAGEGRSRALRARNAAELVTARELARSAVHVAMADLLSRPEAGRLPRDGTRVTIEAPGGTLALRVEDERGKLDLALARPEAVAALFRKIGARHGVDAFAAADLARRAGRAFGRQAEGGEGEPRLRSLAELRRIEGFSAAFVGDLEAHATMFGFGSKVNPRTASREVLEAADLDRRRVDAYLGARGSGLQVDENQIMPEGLTSIEGPVYRIVGTGRTDRGIEETVVALVARVSGAFQNQESIRVLEWR